MAKATQLNTVTIKQLGSNIIRAAEAGQLCVVLGAGFSKCFGGPLWSEIVTDIANQLRVEVPSGEEYSDTIERFYEAVGRDVEKVEAAIRDSIYGKTDFLSTDALLASKAVSAITSRVPDPGLMTFVNFNYDDVLQRVLQDSGFDVSVYDEPPTGIRSRRVRIFHPHGYLPRKGEGATASSPQLVFRALSYMKRNGSQVHPWSTELQQLFATCMTVFVGCSFTDRDRYLLSIYHNSKLASNSSGESDSWPSVQSGWVLKKAETKVTPKRPRSGRKSATKMDLQSDEVGGRAIKLANDYRRAGLALFAGFPDFPDIWKFLAGAARGSVHSRFADLANR